MRASSEYYESLVAGEWHGPGTAGLFMGDPPPAIWRAEITSPRGSPHLTGGIETQEGNTGDGQSIAVHLEVWNKARSKIRAAAVDPAVRSRCEE
jgi:hypothetical protein